MADETAFDEAWERWREDLTNALAPALGDDSAHVLKVLADTGAFDPEDGQIRRDWALGLMTGDDERVRLLIAGGLSDDHVRALTALIRRHPLPAAGG